MTTTRTADPQSLTSYSRFVLSVLVLPLLFIAGVQLFVLSAQTETYFAWTFAGPFSAAFLGAGYWAAMAHAWLALRSGRWETVRTSIPAAVTATTLLAITTFVHLDRFHLEAPLFLTRFVTWVWIVVYIVTPPALLLAWVIQSRRARGAANARQSYPAWLKAGFALLAAFGLAAGLGLFFAPGFMATVWPWDVTPLAARAVASWLAAFGVACVALLLENDVRHGAGTCASLLAFCILEMIVVMRYPAAIDWSNSLALLYLAFLVLGASVTGASLLLRKRSGESPA